MNSKYDVLILGGGPAGLSAALALGRMLRTALVCDDGRPRNAASSHANNLIGQDGIDPAKWRENARTDLKKYASIHLVRSTVTSVGKNAAGFEAVLSTGETIQVKKLILADGVKDHLPEAPGFKELWGKGVFHCPYCHGYEFRGQRLALAGDHGKLLEHGLPLIWGLSKDLVIIAGGKTELDPAFRALAAKKSIPIYEAEITSLSLEGEKLKTVNLSTGIRVERDGLLLMPKLPFEPKSSIGTSLGCEAGELGFYKTQDFGKTSVPGVFAAGDIATMMHSVTQAAALGQAAGAGAVSELLHEELHA